MSTHPIDIVAICDIKEGETLTFDYTATEWEMADPFEDLTSGLPCRGFRHLPAERKVQMLHDGQVSSHIMRMWLLDQTQQMDMKHFPEISTSFEFQTHPS